MQDVDPVGNEKLPQLPHGSEIHFAAPVNDDRFEPPALRHSAQRDVIVVAVVDCADAGLDTPRVQMRNE